MIKNINIADYKCLHNEHLDFAPLTVITGLNSTGKSSLIQSLLWPIKAKGKNGPIVLNDSLMSFTFDAIRNKYQNAKEVKVNIEVNNSKVTSVINNETSSIQITPHSSKLPMDIEDNLYYLSANRIGIEQHTIISPQFKVGVIGEYLLGTFETEKSTPVIPELRKEDSSYTLSSQLNYWLSYILDIPTELQTEKRIGETVEIRYTSDGLNNLSPFQLGAGVNYLTKILIMCLRAKQNDIIIIENPEIHLHPASQARVADFLAFIAKAGIQVIVETHCEHLLFKLAYQVYKKKLSEDDVIILYKSGIQYPFVPIGIRGNGKFTQDFPEGFFDATLSELLEIE